MKVISPLHHRVPQFASGSARVGDPFLRDDILLALVMPGDGRCVVSADFSGKVFLWSLDGVHESRYFRI
jgi:hypothetical protein